MKLACVDKAAGDRIELQQLIDQAFEQSRSCVGHLTLLESYPASKDELLLNSAPDLVVVDSQYSVEDSFQTCRDIKKAFPDLPVLVFFQPEAYSLRTLRRFERVADEVFSTDDPLIRIVHKLSSFRTTPLDRKTGKLIVVSGVKGGVGATSITSGLAHAADAIGKSAVVADLSQSASLVQYLGAKRWHSPEYTALLVDGLIPDRSLVERCITVAPNGIHLLLPPSGGRDVREIWLRDSVRFETTLTVIDILRELYEVILVDSAGIEGVLSFALHTRADMRLLVTSNDPASVHLLNAKLTELSEVPGEGQIQIAVNQLFERGLTKEDIVDFLSLNDSFEKEMAMLESIPYEARGRLWIGTGNSFFTESRRSLQRVLEEHLKILLLNSDELRARYQKISSIFSNMHRPTELSVIRAKIAKKTLKAIPFFGANISFTKTPPEEHLSLLPPDPVSLFENSKGHFKGNESNGNLGSDKAKEKASQYRQPLYSAPKEVPSETGSLSLEQILLVAGAVIISLVVLPTFFNSVSSYLDNFQDRVDAITIEE